jgi:hypothetical protein
MYTTAPMNLETFDPPAVGKRIGAMSLMPKFRAPAPTPPPRKSTKKGKSKSGKHKNGHQLLDSPRDGTGTSLTSVDEAERSVGMIDGDDKPW